MRIAERSSTKSSRAPLTGGRRALLLTPWFLAAAASAVVVFSGWSFRRHLRAERDRIARELHDTLAQKLAGAALQLEGLDQALPIEADMVRKHVRRARDLVHQSLDASRRVVWDLRQDDPPGGLSDALRRLGEPFAGLADLKVAIAGRERRLPAATEEHLLRIGGEAVANAVRHGEAQHVRVQLCFEDERILLLVEDDGAGFSLQDLAERREGHFGLLGMSERARQMRGSLSIASQPGAGTRVHLEIPTEDRP